MDTKMQTATADKIKAHGRVGNHFLRGRIFKTPFGDIKKRPKNCQVCGKIPHSYGRIDIPVAHHYDGYGDNKKDLSVVFVCRSCHQKLHRGKLSLLIKRNNHK